MRMAIVDPKPDGRGMELLNSLFQKYPDLQIGANPFAMDDPKILHDFGESIQDHT